MHHDQCLLVLYKSSREWIRCGWHVDDGVFAQKGEDLWKWYLCRLREKYFYTLEPLTHFCGVNYHIDYECGIVRIEQTALIEKGLRDIFRRENLKSARYPVDNKVPQPSKLDIPDVVDSEVADFPMKKAVGYTT